MNNTPRSAIETTIMLNHISISHYIWLSKGKSQAISKDNIVVNSNNNNHILQAFSLSNLLCFGLWESLWDTSPRWMVIWMYGYSYVYVGISNNEWWSRVYISSLCYTNDISPLFRKTSSVMKAVAWRLVYDDDDDVRMVYIIISWLGIL